MGVRLQCTYKPTLEDPALVYIPTYRMEIHDKNGGGGDEVCLVRGKEPAITTEGESRSLYNVVQPSSCKFTIYVDNPAARAFIQDYAASTSETRFRVIVYNDYSIEWIGVILPDEVSIEEKSWPDFEFTMTAVCGLTYLQNIPYTDASNQPFGYSIQTIEEHIGNVFAKLPTKDLYGTSKAVSITKDWEDDVTGGDFSQLYLNHVIFQTQDETSEGPIPFTCWDVLKYICHAFDFRLYSQSFGFVFEQINMKIGGSIASTDTYDINMNSTGSLPLASDLIPVDCDGSTWLLEGDALRTFKGPIRQSATTYYFRGFASAFKFPTEFAIAANAGPVCNNNLGVIVTAGGEGRLRLTGTFEFLVDPDGPNNGDYPEVKVVFYITIKVGSNNYFNREVSGDRPIYYDNAYDSEGVWETANNKYAVYASNNVYPASSPDVKYSMPFEIETLPLDAAWDGDQLSICFEAKAYDQDSNEISMAFVNTWWIDRHVYMTDKDENKVEDAYIQTTILANDENTLSVEYDMIFGDGPSMVSESRFYAGLMLEPTTEWTSGVVGGPYAIYEMSARSRLMRQRRMITFLEGTIEGFINRGARISYDGEIWTFIRGTYHTGLMQLQGEWANAVIGSAAGSKVAITGVDRTARSPGKGVAVSNGGMYYSRVFYGPLSSATITDLQGYNPDDWTDEQMRALVLVFRNGVQQMYKRTGPGGGIDGFNITWNASTMQMSIVPYEPLEGAPHSNLQAEWLHVLLWQF